MTYLEISGLVKTYGDASALRGVSLSIEPGEVHGLVGENGAGKSTLVKALSGMIGVDRGEVTIEGRAIRLGSISASRGAGIRTAFQELSLLPNLSVAENLLVADLPTRSGIVRRRLVEARAREILDRWEVTDIDPAAVTDSLPLSAQQRLELVRAFEARPSILILDEPTAALPDTAWIFRHVRAAAARGSAVIYISHKLAEIEELCDRGSIMRNGLLVGEFTRSSFEHDSIIASMIGRSIDVAFPPTEITGDLTEKPILHVRDLVVGDRLNGVSLDLRPGEIVGVAGLEGQGQKELFYSLAGAEARSSGTVELNGTAVVFSTPREALRANPGVALVPEERKREGIFADASSIRNISAPILKRVSTLGLVSSAREIALAAAAGASNYFRPENLSKDVGRLSGGNQQKTILARTALSGARVLLMFDPTRGIDPAAKLEVYRSLRTAAANGAAILLYSTEIPELIGMSDRIIVLYAGQVVEELRGDDMREEAVMAAAVGGSGHRRSLVDSQTESHKNGRNP